MAYNAQTLITRALYLSNIVSPALDTPTSDQINEGLFFLNELLSLKSIDMGLIPYFSSYTFNGVIGQEAYIVPNLLDIETMTFNLGSVRYSMLETNRDDYFGSGRVNNIQSLPYQYHWERTQAGSTVYVYFLPQQAFTFVIWGKFGLGQVASLQTDLSISYELNYLAYLRYALAEYMCQNYNLAFSPDNRKRLDSLEQMIRDISPLDLECGKMTQFSDGNTLNYAQVNIGKGWTSPI